MTPSAPPPDTVAADEEDELAGLSALDSLPPTPATLPGVNADSSSAAAGSSDSHEVQLNPVVSPPDRAQEEQADTPPQVTRQGSFSVLQVGDSLLGGRGSLLNIPKRRSPSASSIASLQAFDANDLDDVPEDSVSTSSPLEDDEHKGKPKPRPMKEVCYCTGNFDARTLMIYVFCAADPEKDIMEERSTHRQGGIWQGKGHKANSVVSESPDSWAP